MKTKKLTKLQRIKQKAFNEGVGSLDPSIVAFRVRRDIDHTTIQELKKEVESLKKEVESLNKRVASYRDIMRAINSISEGTSRL